MRQVLVKTAAPAMLVLSGMVTSATNAALLVQSGGLVGNGVPTVAVVVGCVAEVAVAVKSSGSGANVSPVTGACVSVTGTSVAAPGSVATGSSVAVGVVVSPDACPLQADKASVSS